MCGFCGFIGHDGDGEAALSAMMESIRHRGPESEGRFVGDGLALGFRRLSIVGLENGNQPIYNESKNLALVFNGEIYNHRDLRRDLEGFGHVFSSDSDAEVLLHLYEEHGSKMMRHLRGMFAFVICNIPEKSLFAVRDPFGIKPLYYAATGAGFLFASEAKAFMRHPGFVPEIDRDVLENYLSFQYSPLDRTIFKGAMKLPPGHFFEYSHFEGGLKIDRYSNIVFSASKLTMEVAASLLDEAVSSSVAAHMESDVEVGSFLSGGVDSSYIAAVFGGKKAFTVGFERDGYSEIGLAKELADELGLEHITKVISPDEFFGSLGAVQYHMDEPLADPSAVALYFLCETASRHVKVALSGEGADELFGGYNIYREPGSLRPYSSLPRFIRKALAALAARLPAGVKGRGFLIRGSKTVEERYIGGANIFTVEERRGLLKEPVSGLLPLDIAAAYYDNVKKDDDVTKMQYLDINLWLVGDILQKADKMSMAHGLELRVPYLDKHVLAAAAGMPANLRVGKDGTKLAFREAAKKRLPKAAAARKKLGFPIPIRHWLREEKYSRMVADRFESDAAREFFHTDKLMELLNAHRSGKGDYSRKIWTVFMFLVWHGEYFGGRNA